jgi:hypothetical protein
MSECGSRNHWGEPIETSARISAKYLPSPQKESKVPYEKLLTQYHYVHLHMPHESANLTISTWPFFLAMKSSVSRA